MAEIFRGSPWVVEIGEVEGNLFGSSYNVSSWFGLHTDTDIKQSRSLVSTYTRYMGIWQTPLLCKRLFGFSMDCQIRWATV